MARATRNAIEIAADLGEEPSRVQGWIERDFGPANDTGVREHFRELIPLMGEGRDGAVAVYKMAAHGRPCRRLRDLLLDERPEADSGETVTADDLAAAVVSSPELAPIVDPMRNAAEGLPAISGEEDSASAFLGAAMLFPADALSGAGGNPGDTVDLARIIDHAFLDPPHDDGYPSPHVQQFVKTIVEGVASVARQARQWVTNASPDELCRGVSAANRLVDTFAVIDDRFVTLGDEERWRMVGHLTPLALPLLKAMMAVVDMMNAYESAQTGGPRQAAYMRAINESRAVFDAPQSNAFPEETGDSDAGVPLDDATGDHQPSTSSD